MKVTILIPTLNRLNYLKESLTSAREQTHKDLQILISDDGSHDGTQGYIQEVIATDKRVDLTPANPRQGLFTNINHLLSHVSGEAFCILADDDRLAPEFISELVHPLVEDSSLVAAFCDHWIINKEGRRLLAESEGNSRAYGRAELETGIVDDALTWTMRGAMCMGFSLYRSRDFQTERFDLACGGAADFDYAIRAAEKGRIYYLNRKLGDYRAHEQTVTATQSGYMLDGIVEVFKKHSFVGKHEALRKNHLAERFSAQALYYSTLNRGKAFQALRERARLHASSVDARVFASAFLALLPRPFARMLKQKLRGMKAVQS
jgi:glycosyltransferase involved in cell wall biosynthesis